MKKYSKYKDSGNKWLGQIPEHWKVGKIKLLCDSIFAGATPSTGKQEYWEGGSIPWIPSGCCHDCKIKEAPKFITEAGLQNSSTKMIPANTTVMALTGATCAQLGYLTFEACANQSVVAFVENKKKADSRFLYYSLYAAREEILTHKSGGAQGGINQEDCRNTQIVIIPLSEQQAIADFLDAKTEKIDQSIALLETQKTDLQAYRNRLIDEMLWNKTGEVKNICFKYITEAITVKGISHIKVGLENIESGTGKYIATESNFEGNGIAFIKGDILYGKLRPYLKKVWRADFEGAAIGDFYVYRAKSDVLHSKYLQYFLLSDSFTSLANSSTYGAKMPRVSSDFIGNILISLPPLSEQQTIVKYLDKKTNEIDAALKQIDTQITDLQAYRTALISEAVTGKIDVR